MANVWARVRIAFYAQSLNQVDTISQKLTEMVTPLRCDCDYGRQWRSIIRPFDEAGAGAA
jgi:hypothetical protein